jgi:hypothetical protein
MKNIEAFLNRCKFGGLKWDGILREVDDVYCIGWFLCVDDKTTNGVGKLRMRPEDFNLIKVIGRGAYGEVQLVSC